MIIKPWTIYLWRNGDKIEGACPIVTKDGIKEIYRSGWEIEEDPEATKNEDSHKEWRAKNRVKELLNNTMNVLNWYGKKVLDDKGNVDKEKFDQIERLTAFQAVKNNVDMEDLYKIKKFPVEEITNEEALKYKFKGNHFDKYINKETK